MWKVVSFEHYSTEENHETFRVAGYGPEFESGTFGIELLLGCLKTPPQLQRLCTELNEKKK
jgi:hypothetical protein